MRSVLLALSLPVLVLAGCSSDGEGDAADPTDTVSTATSAATQDTTPSAAASSTAPSTAPSATATKSAPPAPKAKKSRSTSASVRADVENVAVSLESYYRGGDYPRTLAQVKVTLSGAGLELSPGNELGSYVYDDGKVEFTLCVEGDGGQWATYNTAPMTIQESGETGGCP